MMILFKFFARIFSLSELRYAWVERIVTTVWVEHDERHRPLSINLRGPAPQHRYWYEDEK
jgi:hypothetical protein